MSNNGHKAPLILPAEREHNVISGFSIKGKQEKFIPIPDDVISREAFLGLVGYYTSNISPLTPAGLQALTGVPLDTAQEIINSKPAKQIAAAPGKITTLFKKVTF